MIRIRPGRSWRHNPGYLDELRGLTPPRARAFTGGGILDVLGIEVDGVDIAAGVGEAPVVVAVDELTQALLRLCDGEPAAQATVGPGPTELVLEPRGQDVLVALVTLRPPSRVLAGGLLLDGARLRSAALTAARGLLADLIDVAPALEGTPLARRLSRACAALERKTPRQGPAWPGPQAGRRGRGAGFTVKAGKPPARIEVEVPADAAARMAAKLRAPYAPLAPLLGAGNVTLRLDGAPALSIVAPPFLALRDLVREAGQLVQAWEAGDRSFTLRAGSSELRCDLTRDAVRATGWPQAAQVTPAQLALALAGGARAFAERALSLSGGAASREEPLSDLRAAASELLEHCRDLSSGDLRRAPEAVRAPPPLATPATGRSPLSVGRMRRLLYREAFQLQVGPVQANGLHLFGAGAERELQPSSPRAGGVAVLSTEGGLQGLDLASGRLLWQLPGIGVAVLPARARRQARGPGEARVCRSSAGTDLFATEGETLLLLDPSAGQPRWRRRMRGSEQRLWAVPGGVVRALSGGGVALVSDAGTLTFRAPLDEGAPQGTLLAEGVLLLAFCSGVLCGLDAQDGSVLWRRRVGARLSAPVPLGNRALVIAQEARGTRTLLCLEAATGQSAWERPLPGAGPLAPVTVFGDLCAVPSAEGLLAVRARDGVLAFAAALPWGPSGALLAAEELDEIVPGPSGARARRARGPGLIAASPAGALARLDERGAVVWSTPAPSEAAPCPPPQLARGILLSCSGGATLVDVAEGLVLSRLSQEAPAAAALAPDLTVALLDSAGALSVHQLGLHLSVV